MRPWPLLLSLLLVANAYAANITTPAQVNFSTCTSKPEWPKESLRKEETGIVDIKFLIDEEGKVLDTFVQKSSGSSLLDDAAVLGLRRCGFSPATINGHPVRRWQKMQYRWQLETEKSLDAAKEKADTYRAAALTGDAGAIHQFAQLFLNGEGYYYEPERYLRLLRTSAEKSYGPAEFELGANYQSGVHLRQDQSQALIWLLRAAKHGYAAAQYRLGVIYESGQGAPQDLVEAADWYGQAAQQGDHAAQTALGRLLEAGLGVARNTALAASWYRKAASAGDTEAAYHLGLLYLRATDVSQALPWLTMAAADRQEKAEAALANLYLGGSGVKQSDDEGIKYLRRAALAGDPPSMRQLGLMLSQGLRMAADTSEGKLWLDRAARMGAPANPDDIVRFGL